MTNNNNLMWASGGPHFLWHSGMKVHLTHTSLSTLILTVLLVVPLLSSHQPASSIGERDQDYTPVVRFTATNIYNPNFTFSIKKSETTKNPFCTLCLKFKGRTDCTFTAEHWQCFVPLYTNTKGCTSGRNYSYWKGRTRLTRLTSRFPFHFVWIHSHNWQYKAE